MFIISDENIEENNEYIINLKIKFLKEYTVKERGWNTILIYEQL